MKTLSALRFAVCCLLIGLGVNSHAQTQIAAEEMTAAANNFLAALTAEQQARARFEWKDEERYNWHFIPRERKGLPFKEMNPAQRQLAAVLLNSGLSYRGYAKAVTVMSLEQILHEMENRSPRRDAELYFFSIFGQPGAQSTWGWRVEGHHLSLNFTLVKGGHVSVTPAFLGTNPAEVREGARKGLRVLAVEEDLGRQLVKSLGAEQKRKAIFAATAPRDIFTGSSRQVAPLEPPGVAAADFTPAQKDLLRKLVREYVFNYRADLAELDLQKIEKAGFDKITFAWAGGTERGDGHYYRVQGPTFLLEYDNTQNNANHVHAVWRDFKNDFGEDLLRRHYEQTPHP